jgi:hypothetical protein
LVGGRKLIRKIDACFVKIGKQKELLMPRIPCGVIVMVLGSSKNCFVFI